MDEKRPTPTRGGRGTYLDSAAFLDENGNQMLDAVMNPNGTLSCIGVEGDSLPQMLEIQYPNAKYLDVSFGKIEHFENMTKFECLKALIADQNNVSSLDSFPIMRDLHTLSLNKNKIDSLDVFLREASGKFPKLAFISLINNPCCPMEMFGATQEQYDEYRFHLLKKFPSLRFIDSKPVLEHERPRDVETISQKKLRTGQISEKEHAHIMKMNAMLENLDDDDETMNKNQVDEDESAIEYTESPEQEYFASILESARMTSDEIQANRPKDTQAINDLTVFEKVVQAQVTTLDTVSSHTPQPRSPGKKRKNKLTPPEYTPPPTISTRSSKVSVSKIVVTDADQDDGADTSAVIDPEVLYDSLLETANTHAKPQSNIYSSLFKKKKKSVNISGKKKKDTDLSDLEAADGSDQVVNYDSVRLYDRAQQERENVDFQPAPSLSPTNALSRTASSPNPSSVNPNTKAGVKNTGGSDRANRMKSPEITQEEVDLWGSLNAANGNLVETGYEKNKEPLYDAATINLIPAEQTEKDRKLRIAAWLGEQKIVTIIKSPTGLDMQIVADAGYIRIAQIVPRGAAHVAGLQVGDVLLSCNNRGLVDSSVAEAENVMLETTTSQIELAPLELPLPEFQMQPRLASRKYSVGAVTKSVAVRPLYCEVDLKRQSDGSVGFTVNTNGIDPLVDTVIDAVRSVKPGDILKSVNGDPVNVKNVNKILSEAENPLNLDLIRYMIESNTPQTPSRPTTQTSIQTQSSKKAKLKCDSFEATFKGRLDKLEKGSNMSELVNSAAKQAKKQGKKEAKLRKKSSSDGFSVLTEEDQHWDEGKVKIEIFADAISVKRFHNCVPKSLHSLSFVSDPSDAPPTVFNVLSSDIFTSINNNRRIILMIQSAEGKNMTCYILKFPKKKDCDRAFAGFAKLPGHVTYKVKAKANKRLSKSPLNLSKSPLFKKKDKVSPKKEKEREKENKETLSPPPTPTPTSTPTSPTTPTTTTANTDEEPKPRRRKLVRGANKVEQKILPEFQAALDALDDLDRFLDAVGSVDKELAVKTPHLSVASSVKSSRGGNINKAKSRKWFKEYVKINKAESIRQGDLSGVAIDNDAGNDVIEENFLEVFDDNLTVDETDDEDDDDDDISNLMSDDLLKVLAEKRQSRAIEQEARKVQLKELFNENRSKEVHKRQEELKKFEQEMVKERAADEEYKEYCAVGAQKRLRELTFKFKFGENKTKPPQTRRPSKTLNHSAIANNGVDANDC